MSAWNMLLCVSVVIASGAGAAFGAEKPQLPEDSQAKAVGLARQKCLSGEEREQKKQLAEPEVKLEAHAQRGLPRFLQHIPIAVRERWIGLLERLVTDDEQEKLKAFTVKYGKSSAGHWREGHMEPYVAYLRQLSQGGWQPSQSKSKQPQDLVELLNAQLARCSCSVHNLEAVFTPLMCSTDGHKKRVEGLVGAYVTRIDYSGWGFSLCSKDYNPAGQRRWARWAMQYLTEQALLNPYLNEVSQ